MALNQVLSEVMDQLALGVEMFGDHAFWLWILPLIWGIAGCMIWNTMQSEKEALERVYVANAEQNLPRLKELVKQRSTEILEVRAINRDAANNNGQNRKL
ncbi:MAG: hypothetical protein ACR2QF_06820 [Geminicoccaceae bacterium]